MEINGRTKQAIHDGIMLRRKDALCSPDK